MIIHIKVKTHCENQKIEKISDTEYKVSLKSMPEDNRANLELIKLLKKYFSRNINIIKGLKSKNKLIKVGEN